MNSVAFRPPALPSVHSCVSPSQVQYIAGGATQNSIRVAQWMLQDPGHTGFLGAIGSDEFGAKLSACAKEDGVDAHYFVDATTPTGTCAVLVNSGDRSLVANLAAANKFLPSHLDTPKAKEMVESARFYYIAGFFLTVSVDAILQIAKPAAQSGKVCVVAWLRAWLFLLGCFVLVGWLCACFVCLFACGFGCLACALGGSLCVRAWWLALRARFGGFACACLSACLLASCVPVRVLVFELAEASIYLPLVLIPPPLHTPTSAALARVMVTSDLGDEPLGTLPGAVLRRADVRGLGVLRLRVR